jgi:hypothetical protein
MKTLKQHIFEKLKIKTNVSRMTLTEFNKTRKSLNRKENEFKLSSQYDMKDMFINWVEQMLIEDGVITELPFTNHMDHIIRFDGDILIDNIVDDEIDPPVSTELYLTWGEAYMRIVTYYVKYEVFDDDCNLIYEKLKVSNNFKDTTKVPDTITYVDKKFLNDIYEELKMMAAHEELSEDDDLSHLVNHFKERTKNNKKYQTKEMLWSYISIVLTYDYMFDDDDMDRFDQGYLSPDWDEEDPIEEFVYRAVYDANNQ